MGPGVAKPIQLLHFFSILLIRPVLLSLRVDGHASRDEVAARHDCCICPVAALAQVQYARACDAAYSSVTVDIAGCCASSNGHCIHSHPYSNSRSATYMEYSLAYRSSATS